MLSLITKKQSLSLFFMVFLLILWRKKKSFFSWRKAALSSFLNHRHITDSVLGEDNIALILSFRGWRQLSLVLASLWLSTICVRNSQSQTKEIGKVFFLSVLQSLKIAIKHLDKISRWWQGKKNDQSQALLNPLNITYNLDTAVTRHSLILGEFSGNALFPGYMTTGGTR